MVQIHLEAPTFYVSPFLEERFKSYRNGNMAGEPDKRAGTVLKTDWPARVGVQVLRQSPKLNVVRCENRRGKLSVLWTQEIASAKSSLAGFVGTASIADGTRQHLKQMRRYQSVQVEMIYTCSVLKPIRHLFWRYDPTDTLNRGITRSGTMIHIVKLVF